MTPEEMAAARAARDKEDRDLAAQITQMTKLGYDPMTVRKGIITAVADSSTPPTVSLNIGGDTTTLISGVRILNDCTPFVGQTILVGKQGTEIFMIGAIASVSPYATGPLSGNGWVKATLSNGTHNGNSEGDVYYRRVLVHGSWKMEWRGGWAPGGQNGMISAGAALTATYRPTGKRTVTVARETQSDAVTAQFDFQTDGTVNLVGATTSTASTDPNDTTTTVSGHSHGVTGSHVHTPTHPAWVSLHGVEYYL